MKSFKTCLLAILCVVLLASSGLGQALAISPISSPPTAQPAPNMLISSFGFADSSTVFVELYNQSDTPIDINNWLVSLTCSSQSSSCTTSTCSDKVTISIPKNDGVDGWLRNKSYYMVQLDNFSCSSSSTLSLGLYSSNNNAIQTISDIPQPAAIPTIWKQYQRSYSVNSTRDLTGDFSSDYEKLSDKDVPSFTPYSDGFYYPPADTKGLQIVEILPHSKSCLPWNNDTLCHDYIKLYRADNNHENITPGEYSLAYKSADSDAAHYINLASVPDAGHYALVNTDNSDNPLDLTNSGGYVWLTDAGNISPYKNTAVNYPSASSTQYVGVSYAYDGTNWRWTTTPKPFGKNIFTAITSAASGSSSSLMPCRSDQYRNPLTNRCNIKVTAQTLVPCASDQYRNPATNRCRSLLDSSSSLKPCAADQYRNPATNRCKSKTSASGSLKPCQSGWTRSPDTNRCRKTSAVKGAASTIKDVKTPSKKANTEWLIAALVVIIALGYAGYEWRDEILKTLSTTKDKLKLHK